MNKMHIILKGNRAEIKAQLNTLQKRYGKDAKVKSIIHQLVFS